jgi:hypothetical protein
MTLSSQATVAAVDPRSGTSRENPAGIWRRLTGRLSDGSVGS